MHCEFVCMQNIIFFLNWLCKDCYESKQNMGYFLKHLLAIMRTYGHAFQHVFKGVLIIISILKFEN